ncbi:hypothetical protein [Absidia glauca]|uniref:Uncharacterized protein n=1 Tax=Absidia glauca TaxID=4829 RepID=A0A163JH05_ABSGL|nr:hypothetical protein [Absidia glauca]
MQERCYHDQDLLRNASPPPPSRSLDRTHPSPTSSSSRTHRRTHSAAHHQHRHRRQVSTDGSQSQKRSAGSFGRNEGGWLACSPLEELPFAQRNETHQDSLCSSNTASPSAGNGCAKDMLGAISNEDILKLTQLTNKLPVVSRKHNHIQKGDGHTKHRPCVNPEEEECVNNQLHHPHRHPHHKSRHIPTDSQLCDIGLAELLSQDFMKTSSPASTTDTSGLLTVPSCNPSTLSTDTDDSHFSWHNKNNDLGNSSNISGSSNISSRSHTPLHLPALTTTSSQQTNGTTRSAPSLATGIGSSRAPHHSYYHPLTISTTTTNSASPYLDPNCTPNSSHRRSWYKALMKRDKKGKATYDETSHSDYTPPMNDSADFYHSLQQVPTLVDTNNNHLSNNHLKSHTNPIVDTATNALIPPTESSLKRKKSKKQIALERLRLPSRHKRRSSPDIEKYTSTAFHKATKQDGRRRLERIGSNRRHSFDNLRDFGMDPSPVVPPPPSSTSSSSSSAAHSPNSSTAQIPVPHTISTLGNGPDSFSSTGSDDAPKETKTNFKPSLDNDDNSPRHHQHSKRVLYFDYQSLPWDNKHGQPKGVKGLVKMMIDCGYGTLSEKQIKPDDDDEDDDDDTLDSLHDNDKKKDDHEKDQDATEGQEQGDSLPTIESSKVITGDIDWLDAKGGTRQIAEVHVDAENDLGFVKLTQLANDTSLIRGHLLNLSVSFLAPSKAGDDPSKAEDERISYMHENSDLCHAVKDRLVSLEPFLDSSQAFLMERGQQCRAFIPTEDSANDIQQLLSHQQQQQHQRHHSSGSTKSSSQGGEMSVRFTDPDITHSKTSSMDRPSSLASFRTRSSSLWNYVPFKEYNAYEYRQDQLKDALDDLQRGMGKLRLSLEDTETMVHGVQIDMNDTKAKMDTYLKDVPETHYSELKRLEDSIESILANRAKSRGMELLYWLLTALLTGCAFLLWAAICALKLCQTAISFPKKLIKAFNEHMEERNRVIKQAGQRIVAKGADRSLATTTAVRPPTSRRRSSRQLSLHPPSTPSL